MDNQVINPHANDDTVLNRVDILLIEDNLEVKEAMAWFIELQGYSVFCADNGRHALIALKKNLRPALILLDLMMPDMDGFTFRQVQAHLPYLATIPTIVTSASWKMDQIKQRDNEFFMKKPIDTQALLTLFKKYI